MSEKPQYHLCAGDHAAWVEVAGKTEKIYSIEHYEKLKRSTAFIESSDGATFTVHILCDKPRNEWEHDWSYSLNIDGRWTEGKVLERTMANLSVTFSGLSDGEGFKREYVFRAPTLTDDPTRASRLETGQVGTFEIRVYKVKDVRTISAPHLPNELKDIVLDERKHKATLSHLASFGEKKLAGRKRKWSQCTYITPFESPEYRWQFHYRSRDILEDQGHVKIAPPAASFFSGLFPFKRTDNPPPAQVARPVAPLPRRAVPDKGAFSFFGLWPFRVRQVNNRKEPPLPPPAPPAPPVEPKGPAPAKPAPVKSRFAQVQPVAPPAPPRHPPKAQPDIEPAAGPRYALRSRASPAPLIPAPAPPVLAPMNENVSKGKKRKIESLALDSDGSDDGYDEDDEETMISDLREEVQRLTDRLAMLEGKDSKSSKSGKKAGKRVKK